ncbi:hypothetical protein ABLE91_14640 [Aquabacter sp. CN5-332]|uniref:hypothetical protein n=1 Tax=Aquabacter sp. CN5-332 TaxID=3156608 RepID=UPI0032B4B1F1
MIWQPLTQDVNPFDVMVSMAVRDCITQNPNGLRENAPWRSFTYDGAELRLCLRTAPQQSITHNGRAALVYVVAGEGVSGQMGYRCEGRAILDLKTRAFLDVDCQLIQMGHVQPA